MRYIIAFIGLVLIGLIVLGMMPYYILKIVGGIIAIIVVAELVAFAIGMGGD